MQEAAHNQSPHEIKLARWKAWAEAQREHAAQALSQVSASPRAGLLREMQLRWRQQALAERKDWLEAYREHTEAVQKIIGNALDKSLAVGRRDASGDSKKNK